MKKILYDGDWDNLAPAAMAMLPYMRFYEQQILAQTVDSPQKGSYIRHLSPLLEPMSVDEAKGTFDMVYIPEKEPTVLPNIDYRELMKAVSMLLQSGYRIGLHSVSSSLNSLFRLQLGNNPDFTIEIENYVGQSAKKMTARMFDIAHKNVTISAFCQRMQDCFSSWKNQMHPLMDTSSFYLSGTRSFFKPSKSFLRIWQALDTNDNGTLNLMPRKELEAFASVAINEQAICDHYALILSTGHARILNKNDKILSFAGSRRCNLRCSYCFSDHTSENLTSMTEDDMFRIADMVTDGDPCVSLHIDNNLAGEPLCNLDGVIRLHRAMLAWHKQTGSPASFGLLTNATLLDARMLDKLLNEYITYIGVSLDGDEKTHNSIRQSADHLKPTYDKTIRGLKLLQKKLPVDTGISCVLTHNNLDISGLQKHFRQQLDLHHVVMKPVRAALSESYALTSDDIPAIKTGYKAFFDEIYESGVKGNLDPLFTMLQPLDYAGRFLLRTYWGDQIIAKRCGAGQTIFSVNDNGHVYPCDSFNGVGDKEIGNLEDGMHNHNCFSVPYVTEKPHEYGCSKCWARYLCGGVCGYVEHLNHNQYNDVIQMECELSRFLAELALSFWVRVHEGWSAEALESVKHQIELIGVKPLSGKFGFVFAPC